MSGVPAEALHNIDRNMGEMRAALRAHDCTATLLASHRVAGAFGIAVAHAVHGGMSVQAADAALDTRFVAHKALINDLLAMCMRGPDEPAKPPRGSFLPPGTVLNGLARRRHRRR